MPKADTLKVKLTFEDWNIAQFQHAVDLFQCTNYEQEPVDIILNPIPLKTRIMRNGEIIKGICRFTAMTGVKSLLTGCFVSHVLDENGHVILDSETDTIKTRTWFAPIRSITTDGNTG